MNKEENKIYLEILDEIGDRVYQIYNTSSRKDLIMVYEMKEEKIYSYIYEEFMNDLNDRSKKMLKEQYEESKQSKRIVLFIKDKLRRKFKSFTI
jgi:hypothetical protein